MASTTLTVDKSCENWFSGFSFTYKCNCNLTRDVLNSCYNATVRRKSNRLCSYKVSWIISFFSGSFVVHAHLICRRHKVIVFGYAKKLFSLLFLFGRFEKLFWKRQSLMRKVNSQLNGECVWIPHRMEDLYEYFNWKSDND